MPLQREWFEKDYYAELGVPEAAPAKDITKAYRKLAREFHPDARPGDDAAEERFKEISAAYAVLGDADKRKEYDEVRRMAASGLGGFPGGGGVRFGDAGGFDDLLGGLFGGGSRFGRRGGRVGPQPGGDLETDLRLEFEDAVAGVETSVALDADRSCATCHGSGAEPGTSPRVCDQCQGAGMVAVNQGPFSFSQPCPSCGGAGRTIDQPCSSCRGRGAVRSRQDVKVRIPPGVVDGEKIRVRGRGAAGTRGGHRGDLWVRLAVEPHPVFERRGRYDLGLRLPVTFAEATLGTEVKVPTLDGPVTVRIPPGTPNGRTLRVKGKGGHKPGGDRGDVMASVEVAVPQKLTKEERAILEQLAAVDGDSPRAHLEDL